MSLRRLSLTDFRNHADALIVLDHSFVLLTGENGAGKTNILEAVSMLSPGRGLRGAALRDMARQGGPGNFSIAAQLSDVTIGTGTASDAPDRRLVRINGVQSSASSLSEWLSIIWLTPAMDRLFIETPGARRRFLDRLVLALYPGHAVNSTRYEAAMRSRTRLLTGEEPPDPVWLSALEAQMAEHGAALARARRETVAALGEALALQPQGPFPCPALALAEWDDPEADLAILLAQGRRRDAAAGRALAGPHRTDLAVTHAAKGQAAALCSTGEQKALLLSIILAHAELVARQLQRRPILLLDEVAAHLDPKRRLALFDRLAAGGGQIWMTGTEDSLFEGLEAACRLHVSAGQVVQVP